MKKILLVLSLCAFVAGCNAPQEKKTQKVVGKPAFVQSPLPQADVPYQTYTFEAEKGAELTYKTGTKISIPAHALLDEAGKPVSGQVSLAYREFHDALDVLVSGIPMQYDSAGTRQSLQTAGMFDIRAQQAGKNLRLAKGKQAKIDMASWQADADYNFYSLDTVQRNWTYKTREKVIINETKQREKIALEQLRAQLPATRFVLNVGNAFDISVDDDDAKIQNKVLKNAFMQRFQGYKVGYLGEVYGYQAVQVMGLGEHPAHNLVWELVGSNGLPTLPATKDENLFDTDVKSLGNGTYSIAFYKGWKNSDKKQTPIAYIVAKPIMRIASLLAHSPEKWQAEETQLMEKVRQEEERIKQMAEVFRPIAINNFGIHNFDRYLKDDLVGKVMFVDASFKLQGESKNLGAKELKKVFYINPKIRSSAEYAGGNWNLFGIVPEPTVRILAILDNYRIAVVKPEDYTKINFQQLKPNPNSKDRPAHTFTLHEQKDLVKSQEELRKALEMN
ncbi:MAG: hypothetical protein EAZ95_05500 [Bacteroidetes bacterium]|nr:MAG: hypothetical protein EAZ95_05500 [Bacteroidota bacterium]